MRTSTSSVWVVQLTVRKKVHVRVFDTWEEANAFFSGRVVRLLLHRKKTAVAMWEL